MNVTSDALQNRTRLSPRVKNYLTLAFLSLVWGSSFILIKKSLGVYSPIQVGLLRQGFSAVAFLPFLLIYWRQVDWKRWYFYLLIGLCGSAIPSLLFAFAQQHISSSVAGMLNSLTPLCTFLLGLIFFRAKFAGSKLLGVLLGLGGAGLLIFFQNSDTGQADVWYGLLVVLATVCYAVNANLVATVFRDHTALQISMVGFTLIGVPALLYVIFSTDFLPVMRTHPQAWWAFGYVSVLSLVGTVLSTLLYFKLIQRTNPIFATTVTYLMPIVSLFWGVLDGEAIGGYQLAAMALILSGVYLSRK